MHEHTTETHHRGYTSLPLILEYRLHCKSRADLRGPFRRRGGVGSQQRCQHSCRQPARGGQRGLLSRNSTCGAVEEAGRKRGNAEKDFGGFRTALGLKQEPANFFLHCTFNLSKVLDKEFVQFVGYYLNAVALFVLFPGTCDGKPTRRATTGGDRCHSSNTHNVMARHTRSLNSRGWVNKLALEREGRGGS